MPQEIRANTLEINKRDRNSQSRNRMHQMNQRGTLKLKIEYNN